MRGPLDGSSQQLFRWQLRSVPTLKIESPILAIFLENIECDTWAKHALSCVCVCVLTFEKEKYRRICTFFGLICVVIVFIFGPYHIHTSTHNRRTPDLIWCIALHNERLAICRLSPLFAASLSIQQIWPPYSPSFVCISILQCVVCLRGVGNNRTTFLSKSECEACRMRRWLPITPSSRITNLYPQQHNWSSSERKRHALNNRSPFCQLFVISSWRYLQQCEYYGIKLSMADEKANKCG